MFEDKRKLAIYGLLTLLVIIVILILWWLFGPKPVTKPTVVPPTQPAEQTQSETAIVPPASSERVKEDKNFPLGLKQLAMAFAERFGSYSTDEPVKNLVDLEPYMTDRLQKSLSLNTAENPGVFSGISTKALSATLTESNSTAGTVIVKTQRTQTLGAGQTSKSFYADLELKAVKVGNEWKIDAASWQ